jgi:hypothetical protein
MGALASVSVCALFQIELGLGLVLELFDDA